MSSRRSARLEAQESNVLDQHSTPPRLSNVGLDKPALDTSSDLHHPDHEYDAASGVNVNVTTQNGRSRARKGHRIGDVLLDDEVAQYLMTPVTPEERRSWQGWCELESEPAFFNIMLRDLGVQGVKVQEVIGLDEDLLNLLPKPVYGLIFLFQIQEDDSDVHEDSCPEHVWFANQINNNSCASIALLNIVMNIPGLELGPILEQLRQFSIPMTPANRGFVVSSHETIRQIHNSCARKMDMLNADLVLSNEADVKRKRNKKRRYANDDVPGFHFIAFVPIHGYLWKLDGLERQPINLGGFQGDWMHLARLTIEELMQRYGGDQLQFSLLSLCGSPLVTIPPQLAVNIRLLCLVEEQLNHREPNWISWVDTVESGDVLRGANAVYMVTSQQIEGASVDSTTLHNINDSTTATVKLFEMRRELVDSQMQFRAILQDEIEASRRDEELAIGRRHDYTPAINKWLGMLVEKGIVKDVVLENSA